MPVPTTCTRSNPFSSGKHERQLTEAELRVQRSLQKLSIPDWYVNKRSSPPRIINVTPIEFRPPSWRKSLPSKNATLNSTISNLSAVDSPVDQQPNQTVNDDGIKPTTTINDKTSHEQKSSESRCKRSPLKSSPEKQAFDTTIPLVKFSRDISKTFPKMSPSRRLQNINIVLPPGPRIEISNDLEFDTVTSDFANKTKNNNDSNKSDWSPQKMVDNKDSFNVSEILASSRTPNAKMPFEIRASTPKFSPANIFSSTMIEETPKVKKNISHEILEKCSIFENSSASKNPSNNFASKPENTIRPRKLSSNLLEKTYIFKKTSGTKNSVPTGAETSVRASKPNWMSEKNTQKDDSWPKSFFLVRDMVRKLEGSKNDSHTSEKKFNRASTNSTNVFSPGTPAIVANNHSTVIQKNRTNLDKQQQALLRKKKTNSESQSPYLGSVNLKKKSTDSERTAKSKQSVREKSLVQEIIESLSERINESAQPHQNRKVDVNHNFVRQLVDALEKSDIRRMENLARERYCTTEEDSSSESETKHRDASPFPRETDSSSDSDRRSSSPRRNDEQRFNRGRLASRRIPEFAEEISQEEDSVFWIPVSRCKLPRTSSLLSMRSNLSSQSLCLSPINSESETSNYRKCSVAISNKLFRIDETIIIDSGYSDRSDRSAASPESFRVNDWSDNVQYETGSETRSSRLRRSCRRKSNLGHTFSIH
ncbi:uncharacterized protein LOC143433502 [Xylocopa sonorina]|uniref:uncharacterized protein LOC143433502 n=1 Tax=Xylocopa sonorina TaxID=1818115 RepID=UPI00403AADD1